MRGMRKQTKIVVAGSIGLFFASTAASGQPPQEATVALVARSDQFMVWQAGQLLAEATVKVDVCQSILIEVEGIGPFTLSVTCPDGVVVDETNAAQFDGVYLAVDAPAFEQRGLMFPFLPEPGIYTRRISMPSRGPGAYQVAGALSQAAPEAALALIHTLSDSTLKCAVFLNRDPCPVSRPVQLVCALYDLDAPVGGATVVARVVAGRDRSCGGQRRLG